MKKISVKLLLVAIALPLLFSGCLTVQYKIYTFKMNKDGSGTLTIEYKNIMSQPSSSDQDSIKQEIKDDFAELITSYVAGNTIEEEYKNAKVVSKKLYEEKGVLNGRVVIEFEKPEDVGLFKYDKKSPYVMFLGSSMTESYFDSNGKYYEDLDVVAWDRKNKELVLYTSVSGSDQGGYSLLDMWKEFQKN